MKAFFFLLLLSLFSFRQEKVIICKSSTAYAYHLRRCKGLQECTHAIEYVTLQEALLLKRKACDYCYDTAKPAPAISSAKTQCAAVTKKGTQCSRKAVSSGYCWQHK